MSSRRKYLAAARGQRRTARLLLADRKPTVTQIIKCYNQGMQKSIAEGATLKQMGYSSTRTHGVPLLSSKNRKQRQQFTQVHQNLMIEMRKMLFHLMSVRFVLQHLEGRVRIRLK